MAEGDGAAVDVDPAQIGAGLPGPGQHDRGEGLVDLEQVDVLQRQPGPRQHLVGDGDDGGEHEQRVVGLDRGRVDAGPRRAGPSSAALSALAISSAAAPSVICDDVARGDRPLDLGEAGLHGLVDERRPQRGEALEGGGRGCPRRPGPA